MFWLPNGLRVVNGLVDYMREKLDRRGYQEIRTPLIMNTDVWRRSGHLDHYRENMYFVESDEAEFGIKPMNCPGAAMVYESSLRSYRELPLRLSEFGHCHRYERSGVLSGLTRVRSFVQDDAHIYCTPEQIESEVSDLIHLAREVYEDFGFQGFRIDLSTRPPSSMGTDEQWQQAEAALRLALEKTSTRYKVNPGDGAFYGPKIDFQVEDAIGRTHQCATIQADFNQAERFDLYYAAEDGTRKRPVVLHRAILGSLERFMAVLIEHTGGAFPLWLAPLQALVLPITEKHHAYARNGRRTAFAAAACGSRSTSAAKRSATRSGKPSSGRSRSCSSWATRRLESGTVAVRNRKKGDLGPSPVEELASTLERLVRERSLAE